MTNVSIIEIDLGTNIDEIIEEDVETLTGAAKQELDTAIDLAKTRDSLREEKSSEKQKATNALTEVITESFDRLVAAGDDGILCSDIMDIVQKQIPNGSAFTIRMKKILRDKGNPYSLGRKKRKGNQHYVFTPFNEENVGGESASTEGGSTESPTNS
jgi:hypothetical protein